MEFCGIHPKTVLQEVLKFIKVLKLTFHQSAQVHQSAQFIKGVWKLHFLEYSHISHETMS